MDKKTRKSNVKEKKVLGSYKMRPSVKAEAMKFIAEDTEVKSFNDFLEIAVLGYIKEQRRKPRLHKKQGKLID